MKITRKQKLNIIEAKLELSMLQFHANLPWIVRKLFSKQALTWYDKGKGDAMNDYLWLSKKIAKIEKQLENK